MPDALLEQDGWPRVFTAGLHDALYMLKHVLVVARDILDICSLPTQYS